MCLICTSMKEYVPLVRRNNIKASCESIHAYWIDKCLHCVICDSPCNLRSFVN